MARVFRAQALAHYADGSRVDQPSRLADHRHRWMAGVVAACLVCTVGVGGLWRLSTTTSVTGYVRDPTHIVVAGSPDTLERAVSLTLRRPGEGPVALRQTGLPVDPRGADTTDRSPCVPVGTELSVVETLPLGVAGGDGCVVLDVLGPRRPLWTFLAGGGVR